MPFVEPRHHISNDVWFLLWFIYIYHSHYLSLWPVHKEKVMELKGYQGSSNCGCSILLRHFETRLNAAIMRIKKTIICFTSRVTNVNISIIFDSLTVANHDSRGFNIHVDVAVSRDGSFLWKIILPQYRKREASMCGKEDDKGYVMYWNDSKAIVLFR